MASHLPPRPSEAMIMSRLLLLLDKPNAHHHTARAQQLHRLHRRAMRSLLTALMVVLVGNGIVGASTVVAQEPPPRVLFARDILPVLSANCFACHGYDEAARQAELRLDLEDLAKSEQGEGIPVVAGDPERSTLWQRIASDDSDLVMPPPDTHKALTDEEKETVRLWIEQGAPWQQHWAFAPVERPEGNLDDQVARRLAQAGLELQSPAAPQVLIRRLYLDLTGLPPSVEVADAFARDPSPEHYARIVDELLESPRFGEHWARMWLDLARYADTKGYEKDLGRMMWPYRDWVVTAFNQDMPLDQFTVEQLAGDLLPEPTIEQRVATAFHRNTMANDEGVRTTRNSGSPRSRIGSTPRFRSGWV
ncbi:MAG: DUF1549 domain-containing protein [Pirellulaceae bacterium]